MPSRRLQYIPGELQFITSSTYRRTALFRSPRFCRCFVDVLADVRKATGFLLIGWVLMPDHFHLLLKPESAEATSRIVQRLKIRTAMQILKQLRENQDKAWRVAQTLIFDVCVQRS
jgi:REP-associated tyrosine transposase